MLQRPPRVRAFAVGSISRRSPNVSVTTSDAIVVSDPIGSATGMMYQSLPKTVANSVTSNRPRSSGAVSTAPKSTEASSNSHQRAAGIPRNVIGAGKPVHDCNGAASVAAPIVRAGWWTKSYHSSPSPR